MSSAPRGAHVRNGSLDVIDGEHDATRHDIDNRHRTISFEVQVVPFFSTITAMSVANRGHFRSTLLGLGYYAIDRA
jgi:hypothetical protein